MPRQYCTFWIGTLLFGIPVDHVQEVIVHQRITPVPLASESVRGLINLRGQIVAAVDLRACLALPVDNLVSEPRTVSIIVCTKAETLSLLVDRAGDVLDVEESGFDPPPATLDGIALKLLTGVYQLDSHILHGLDVELLIGHVEAAGIV
jgi:purine-binding chemotaxis protein CheW